MAYTPASDIALILSSFEQGVFILFASLIKQPSFYVALVTILTAYGTYGQYLKQKKADVIRDRYIDKGLELPIETLAMNYESAWSNLNLVREISFYNAYLQAGDDYETNKKIINDLRAQIDFKRINNNEPISLSYLFDNNGKNTVSEWIASLESDLNEFNGWLRLHCDDFMVNRPSKSVEGKVEDKIDKELKDHKTFIGQAKQKFDTLIKPNYSLIRILRASLLFLDKHDIGDLNKLDQIIKSPSFRLIKVKLDSNYRALLEERHKQDGRKNPI